MEVSLSWEMHSKQTDEGSVITLRNPITGDEFDFYKAEASFIAANLSGYVSNEEDREFVRQRWS